MNQRLQHRLQVTRRKVVALGKRFCRDRRAAGVDRDINDGGDGEQTFFGETSHTQALFRDD